MTTKTEIKSGIAVTKKFIVDPDFVDPLLEVNKTEEKLDAFEEVEVEEIPAYYGIHLGIPTNQNQ